MFVFRKRTESLDRRFLDGADEIFDPQHGENGFIERTDRQRRRARTTGVRVEDHRVSGGDNVNDVSAQRGNRVRHGQHSTDDAERRVLFHRDPVIAAHAARLEPLDTRHELHNFELRNLVFESADLGLIKLELAPDLRVSSAEVFDNLDDFRATRDALVAELLKRGLGSGAGLLHVIKYAETRTATARRGGSRSGFRLAGARRYGRGTAEAAHDVFHNRANGLLIEGVIGAHRSGLRLLFSGIDFLI